MGRDYNEPICLSANDLLYFQEMQSENSSLLTKNCQHGEPDLERMMKRSDLTADQLKWIWKLWHDFMGPKIKNTFHLSVFYQNLAAQSNGN